MRALITGVGGFPGQHLAAHLLQQRHEVVGVARRDVQWHVPDVAASPTFQLVSAELRESAAVDAMVHDVRPDRIYHLAAASSVDESFRDPMGTLENNVGVLVHILEAAATHAAAARILVVTSSELYGRSSSPSAIDESAPLLPENPYAVSKATQDLLGYQYFVARHLAIVRVRPFNHIGPGQSDRFVTASFARQIAEIERGLGEPVLRVGNLDARRDFTDVRDVVRAYTLALEDGAEGDAYNVGRGEAHSIQEILDRLLVRSSATIRVERDPDRMRPVDAPVLVCDASRLRMRTGWEPRISLDQTLDDLLGYWRARVATN